MSKKTILFALVMRITFCFFIWLSTYTSIMAQQINLPNERLKKWVNTTHKNSVYLSAYFGHGSYSMYGMKRLQNDLIALSELNPTINSNFPSFWLYGMSISQKYDASRFGFDVESMSTGARSSIADYSGQYISDFRCNGIKLGMFIEKDLSLKLEKIKELVFGYRIEAGGLGSKILQKTEITINNMDEGIATQNINMISASPFIEPSIFVKWQIVNMTFLQLNAGFMLDLPTSFRLSYTLPEYKIGWAGYRIKLGLVRQL